MSERETSLSFKPLGPTITYAFGVPISFIFGVVCGKLGAWGLTWLSGEPSIAYIAFYLLSIGMGWWCFTKGLEMNIPVGHVGVPTLFGRRMDHLLGFHKLWWGYSLIFSEGTHWGIPVFMNKIDVSHQTQTSREIEVTGLSGDDNSIRMTGKMSYIFQITRPYTFLDAKNEILALEEIGIAKFRDGIADNLSTDLVKSEVKSKLAALVENAMKSVSKDDYGIGIIKVMIQDIKLPADLEAALDKKRLAEARAAAEEVDATKLIARLEQLKASGLTADRALDYLQAERGNLKQESKRYGFDDMDKFMEVATAAMKQVFGKEKS